MCNAPMEGVKRMWRGGEARPKAPSKVKTAFGRSRRADARCKMCSGVPEALLHPCKTCLGTPEALLRHEKRVRARPNSYCNAATAVLTCRNTFIHEKERLLCVWGYCATKSIVKWLSPLAVTVPSAATLMPSFKSMTTL